jgi:hypothetical protein
MTSLERVILNIGVPAAVILSVIALVDIKDLHQDVKKDIQLDVQQDIQQDIPRKKDLVNTPITLTYGGGTCSQNASFNPIDVKQGSYVTWVSASSGDALDIRFPSGQSPFDGSVSPNLAGGSGQVQSGQAYGVQGNTYNYASISIGGNSCHNAQQLGLRMK